MNVYNIFKHLTPEELKVASKIAQQVSEKEFMEFLVTKETPAVKLSSQELEVLKGGRSKPCWCRDGRTSLGGSSSY
jgi:hypothetical protein